jgi:hypothetical protein
MEEKSWICESLNCYNSVKKKVDTKIKNSIKKIEKTSIKIKIASLDQKKNVVI